MMKKLTVTTAIIAGLLSYAFTASAQYKSEIVPEQTPVRNILESAQSADTPVVITLEQALEIGLSENVAVKVADMEIKRTGYAK